MSDMPQVFPSEKIFSLMPDLSRLLETGLEAVEPRFSTLGQNLQEIYADSSGLTKEIMTFADSMTQDQEGGLRYDIRTMVDQSLVALSGCRETLTSSLRDIEGCTGFLNELYTICSRIQKSAVFLNVIGLNISVEGCRTAEVLEMFENFGDEIKQLAGDISEISSKISENAEKAGKEQTAVFSDITGSRTAFDELSMSAGTAVQNAMTEIQTIGAMAGATLEKAGHHSQAISKTVGEIVISIQFHDIVRQQVEHVVSAFHDVLSILEEKAENTATEEAPDESEPADDFKKGQIYSILALQTAQLKHVAGEIRDVYANMQTDFKNIGEELTLLIENVAASNAEGAGESGLEQTLKNFNTELEKLRELLASGDLLEDKIRKTMQASSRTVSELSEHTARVTSINIDLQYKAINAIIMTNKLGEKGATLEVLARGVRDLAGELDQLVNSVVEKIDAITGLSGLSEASADEPQESQGDIGASVRTLESGIQRLTGASALYSQSVSESGQKADHLMEAIEKAGQELDFFPEWITGTEQVVEALENLLELLSPWKDLGQALSAEIQDDIAKRYTMEKERMIHEQMHAGSAEAIDEADAPAEETGDSGETDDLDDNIELF